ncbi:protoheme IX farnesyltransferase [Sulfolobus sp. SCGC AB-777_G05]|jgi:protoheme IX farnesyltransferase|nr:protoheme IX farnesyltransferase [Sulfolobus sp. SCGC AB-777_G05]
MSVGLSKKVSDYINLAKPKVISLLDMAAIAGFILGVSKTTMWLNILPVLVGGSLAAGGGMIINGGLEIEKDKMMTRTSWRPTVKGEVSRKEAYIVGTSLGIIGTLVSLLDNPLTAFFVALGFLIYVFVYSIFLKPRTWLNIIIGGFAGSAAAWAGYSASSNSFTLESLLLGLLIFAWTPGHFWSLALRFKDDYKKAEIPMLPVLVSEKTSAIAIAISNILMIPIVLAFYLYFGLFYLVIASAVSAILLYFNARLIKNPTAEEAWTSFKISSPYLAVILILLMLFKLI